MVWTMPASIHPEVDPLEEVNDAKVQSRDPLAKPPVLARPTDGPRARHRCAQVPIDEHDISTALQRGDGNVHGFAIVRPVRLGAPVDGDLYTYPAATPD